MKRAETTLGVETDPRGARLSPFSSLALGVDVSEKRGLDLVLLDGSPRPAAVRHVASPDELLPLLAEHRPEVVAIDGPPAWSSSGRSRRCEVELGRLAIQSFRTTSAPGKGGWNRWMSVSIEVHQACARAGYHHHRGGSVRGTAIEVFPHASAVVLAGCLPPASLSKKEWRTSILRAQGIQAGALRSLDQIDAALAALTGLCALGGGFTTVGDPDEGLIVLPASSLPPSPYGRCPKPRKPDAQLRLPGQSRCACGDPSCKEWTSGEFAPGHDAKRKSLLWNQARLGDEAIEELKRRGWKLPPGMRP